MGITTVTIHERDNEGSDQERCEQLHSALADALGFPGHYGANLAALDDCLGDICEPTRIEVVLADAAAFERCRLYLYGHAGVEPTWIDRFARVMRRSARENESIEFVITHE